MTNINLPFEVGTSKMYFRGRFAPLDEATIVTVKVRATDTLVIGLCDNGFHVTQNLSHCGKKWWLNREEAIRAINRPMKEEVAL
jgi:hypothetical protein